ncbi:MAG TPA: hypothetical protein VHR27_15790 [Blastocatellia bacterium]|nr:hypothetical protein [Blastocatellia bacterium]
MNGDRMTARAVTARPHGGAASAAKSSANRRPAERCVEPIRHPTTTRSRGRRDDLTRLETMTLRDATISPIGSAARGAKRIMIQTGIERCDEMISRATVRRLERRDEMINRATIHRIERCDEMISRATTHRREAPSGRHRRRLKAPRPDLRRRRLKAPRLDLHRPRPPAKALRNARRNARRLRAGRIFNSGTREPLGLDRSPKTNRPANDGRPVRFSSAIAYLH